MLQATYSVLQPLLSSTDGFQRFADCKGEGKWPSAGLYLFTDIEEPRLFAPAMPKIIRIGTTLENTPSVVMLSATRVLFLEVDPATSSLNEARPLSF